MNFKVDYLLIPFLFCGLFCFSKPLLAEVSSFIKVPSNATLVEEKLASAGSWANFRNNAGSIRYESNRIFKEGYDLLVSEQSDDKASLLIIHSIPNKFLQNYSDQEKCEKSLSETKESPIVFNNLSFSSIEELSKWFGEFSRGSGKEGKELYKICAGSCSPQYHLGIRKKESNLLVKADIVCGPARDKSDDQYNLKLYSVREG